MPKEFSFPDEAKDAVESILMDASEKEQALDEAMKAVKRFRKIVAELGKYVSKGWPLHVLSLMEEQRAFLRQHRDARRKDWDQLYMAAQERAKILRIWYPKYLEVACLKKRLPLDMSSRHPVYTFEEGFFELTIDRAGTATLSNSERKLGHFPADIGAVVAKLGEEHERIFARRDDGQHFLTKLREHYLGVVGREKLLDGADVPIRRIAGRMASEKKGYLTDQFIVDLSRLAIEGPLEIDARRLELLHTRDHDSGMLLHGVGSVAYVGFVRFEEVSS